jgi:hypothetical protein
MRIAGWAGAPIAGAAVAAAALAAAPGRSSDDAVGPAELAAAPGRAVAAAQASPASGRPAPPLRLRAGKVSETRIVLRWMPRRGVDVARYRVFHGKRRLATLGRKARRYAVRGLRCGTRYRCVVKARGPGGRRLGRRVLRVRTSACGSSPGPGGPGGSGEPSPGGGPPRMPPPLSPPVPDKPASVFLSPSGSDSAPCSADTPCRSFERGYEAAKPGEQVELAAGTYSGQQEIQPDSSKTSEEDVIFRPAAGADVRVDALDVFGAHVEVRGVTIARDFYVKCGAEDVTLRRSKATLFFIRSASDVSIVDTEFGPSDTISQIGIVAGTPECEPAPSNVTLDGVYMHDFTNDDPSVHMECLTVQSFTGMAIRRSRFHHCEDFDILFKASAPTLHSHALLIENTWFDSPWPDGTSAIQFSEPDSGGSFTDVLIRNNSFAGTLTLKPEVSYRNLQVLSNVGTRYGGGCGQATSGHNVWSSTSPCAATDRQAPTGYVDAAGFDFHLQAGAAAINHGHPTNHPATDQDGDARPRGNAPDSGADERS